MDTESRTKRLSHNVSILIFHFVCPTKYRRVVFDDIVEKKLVEICSGIELRYDWITFLELGVDKDHVHFLVQSLPNHSPSEIIGAIKSISARIIFKECPEVKEKLWGGEFWSDGFYVSTVGKNQNEKVIKEYVKNQGIEEEYTQLKLKIK